MSDDFDSEMWKQIIKNVEKINYNKVSNLRNDNGIDKYTNNQNINYYQSLDHYLNQQNNCYKEHKGISAVIDLHGVNMEEAFGKIQYFIQDCYDKKHRNILIITGKGNMGEDSLFIQVPKWLRLSPDIKNFVSSYKRAKKSLGGEGALEVKLKKYL